jgi:hypothetical protein
VTSGPAHGDRLLIGEIRQTRLDLSRRLASGDDLGVLEERSAMRQVG